MTHPKPTSAAGYRKIAPKEKNDFVSALVERIADLQRQLIPEYFPQAAPEKTKQSLAALSRETRVLIETEFGGETAYVCKAARAQAAERNAALRRDRENGDSLATLARKHRLSKTHVRRLCAADA